MDCWRYRANAEFYVRFKVELRKRDSYKSFKEIRDFTENVAGRGIHTVMEDMTKGESQVGILFPDDKGGEGNYYYYLLVFSVYL
jgi:hypothetical protein